MKPRVLLAALLGLALVVAPMANSAVAATARNAAASTAPKPAKAAPGGAVKNKAAPGKVAESKPAAKKPQAGKKATPGKTRLAKKSSPSSRQASRAARKKAAAAPDQPIELVLDAQGRPVLSSAAFYVANQQTGEVLLAKNPDRALPIASITKLMTAIVVLESKAGLSDRITISAEDVDTLKGSGSRLSVGTTLSREEMLQLALMSSENRAASALARYYPGGREAFVLAMNIKAMLTGMSDTRFYDSTGLNPGNVSSPRDLARLVTASARYPLIREFSTTAERYVDINGRTMRFHNTNTLVTNPDWDISLSKTGYISEAGRCLVMQAWMQHQPMVIVLMDSGGRYTRIADAQRVRQWVERQVSHLAGASPRVLHGKG